MGVWSFPQLFFVIMGFNQWQRENRGSRWNEAKGAGWFSRPPPVPVNSYDSVPHWERRFCSQMSWKDFCYKKSGTHLYERVLHWDDYAGKEAFENAKALYWAKMNGFPCEISLPGPDMYIDEIFYDAPVDPRLYEDLYEMPPPPPPPKAENWDLSSIIPTGWDVVDRAPTHNIPEFIFIPPTAPYNSIDNSATIMPTVWGDSPTAPNHTAGHTAPIVPTGWGDEEGCHSINSPTRPNCIISVPVLPTGWGDEEDYDPIHARFFPEIHPNGAFTDSYGNFSSLKHHQKTNARSRGGGVSFKHGNQRWSEQVYVTDVCFGSKEANRWHKASRSSFISKPTNQRCNDQVYWMDKYAKGEMFLTPWYLLAIYQFSWQRQHSPVTLLLPRESSFCKFCWASKQIIDWLLSLYCRECYLVSVCSHG